MTQETLVAIYNDVHATEAACAELADAGIPDDAISWTSAPVNAAATHAATVRERSFWSSLFGGEPDHDTEVYDRSVAGGASVLTVRATAEEVDRVAAILERHDPVEIEDRTGDDASTALDGDDTIYGRGDAVVPLAEERLSVGRRLIDRGTTRVRRFVVERPVSEDVTLHDERVVVERRPVAGHRATAASFTDRVVEMTATAEEPVIGKTAHVAEEVVLRKEGRDRVETVHDTVRREEVEITQHDAARAQPR